MRTRMMCPARTRWPTRMRYAVNTPHQPPTLSPSLSLSLLTLPPPLPQINFHHFSVFRVNPVVHEKRGVVGYSKTRRREPNAGMPGWMKSEAAPPRRGQPQGQRAELSVIKPAAKRSSMAPAVGGQRPSPARRAR